MNKFDHDTATPEQADAILAINSLTNGSLSQWLAGPFGQAFIPSGAAFIVAHADGRVTREG